MTGNIKRDGKPLKLGSIAEFDAEDGDRLAADGYLSTASAADEVADKKAGDKKAADKKGS
ncbi:hypothetical protein EPN44_15960 [bacterium]|nr:MAG: hypothetical protein EPN44_15960 [bacterium]